MEYKRTLRICFFTLAVTTILLLFATFLNYFPNENRLFGHDYLFTLPAMLDSAIWIQKNGWTSIPWFSPSLCGGLPSFPDPQNSHYSILSFFVYYFGPINGVNITFLLISILSFLFSYLFLRKVCKSTDWQSLLGATLFVLNSFFISRMIIGHVLFSYFMFVPLVLYLLFDTRDKKISILLLAFIFSFFIYGGQVFSLILSLFVCVIFIFYFAVDGRFLIKESLYRIILSCFFTLIFSSVKLVASFNYFSRFSKDFYPIPGIDSIWVALLYPFKLLLFDPPKAIATEDWDNLIFTIAQHELEYKIGIIPILIILIFIANVVFKSGQFLKIAKNWRGFAILSFFLLLPIFLNFHSELLYPLFKKIPVVNQLVAPTRWYAVYIPFFVFASIDLLKHLSVFFKKPIVNMVLVLLAWLQFHYSDRSFYVNENYNPKYILGAFGSINTTAKTHKISKVINLNNNIDDKDKMMVSSVQTNEYFIFGHTATRCYSPIFGYRLEVLPRMLLNTNNVSYQEDGFLNINNPSCYVFSEENNCKAGDRFKVDDLSSMKNFVNYHPFDFKISLGQKVANFISPISMFLGFIYLVFKLLIKLKSKQTK